MRCRRSRARAGRRLQRRPAPTPPRRSPRRRSSAHRRAGRAGLKPPSSRRRTTASSWGTRCTSGSTPMWRKNTRWAWATGWRRSATACGPRQRSDMCASRARSSGGVRCGPTADVEPQQPQRGELAGDRRGDRPRLDQPVHPRSREAASSRRTRPSSTAAGSRPSTVPRTGAVRVDERDVRADGDAVQAGQHPVVVVADRERPAVLGDDLAQVAAVAADGDRRDLQLRVAAVDGLQVVQRAGAVAAAGGQEGEHERAALQQLAGVEHLGPAHLAGGPVAGAALSRAWWRR